MNAAARLKEWCLDIVFPKYCLGCGREGLFLCSDCGGQLVFLAPACPVCSRRNFSGVLCDLCQEKSGALRRFLAPFSYREPLIRDLIHAYKYQGVRELKTFFAGEIEAFLNFYGIRPHGPAVLAPIPLHRSRLRERGFNQAELLAKELGRKLNLAVVFPLRRRRATEEQVDMENYELRRKNVSQAFGLADPSLIRDKTVIMVDDVSTSGATLSEAASLLRSAGARTVWAIVIAKG